MNGKLVVDANAFIAYRLGNPAAVRLINAADVLFLPVVVYGELLYGAANSSQSKNNLDAVELFAAHSILVPVDEQVARHYAEIRIALRKSGKPIPENDLWIAAICKKLDLPLLTQDEHFNFVMGLRVQPW
ncbi:MAG: type II toxin-antitoxin system VapC family toxin [Candidatus Kryptoniota bacterium]